MGSRRTVEDKILMVKLYFKFENYSEVIRQWNNFSNSEPPKRDTISGVIHRFEETGSVADSPRSGRFTTLLTDDALEDILNIVDQNPSISIRRGSLETGLSATSFARAMDKLDYRPYCAQYVVSLSDDDFDRRMEFSDVMITKFLANPTIVDHILYSDEAQILLNGTVNRHNTCYWGPANPDVQIPVLNSKQGVMAWCGVTSTALFGPYFFEGNVGTASYLNMLNQWPWPQVRYKRLMFQQDGAPAHYALLVRQWLTESFTITGLADDGQSNGLRAHPI